jgi:hypothetical protein
MQFLIMHSLHEMNAYRADYIFYVHPSVRMIPIENRWMDFDEIWHGRYAIGVSPKIVLFDFLHLVIPIWRADELVSCERY